MEVLCIYVCSEVSEAKLWRLFEYSCGTIYEPFRAKLLSVNLKSSIMMTQVVEISAGPEANYQVNQATLEVPSEFTRVEAIL